MDVMGINGAPLAAGADEDQRAQSAAPPVRPGSTPGIGGGAGGRDMRERSKSSMAAKR
jgi:hypothetical protein